jgi:predicted O-methyltransferase YrrM
MMTGPACPPRVGGPLAEERFREVDDFLDALLIPQDPTLESALRASATAGLPAIQVSPSQGKFLHLLSRLVGARRILEVGTLGGYSTIWLARALPPGGRLFTLEVDPRHAEVAQRNLKNAGVEDRVEIRLGRAIDSLPKLAAEGVGPFDLTFIDADKPGTFEYFDWAVRLSRPGAVIVVDNVVRQGAVVHAADPDPSVQGIRRFLQRLATDARVSAVAMQTVGRKGHDGFVLAVVGPAAHRIREGQNPTSGEATSRRSRASRAG